MGSMNGTVAEEVAGVTTATGGRKAVDHASHERLLSDDELRIVDHFMAGGTVGDAAMQFDVPERSLRRWLGARHPLGRALIERIRDRRDQVAATRAVMNDPKTPPSSRLASIVLLEILTRSNGTGGFPRLPTEADVLTALHEVTRRLK